MATYLLGRDENVSVEIFQVTENDQYIQSDEPDAEPVEPGFYWWYCWAGCMPDSDPFGPFLSAQLAFDNAVQEVKEAESC